MTNAKANTTTYGTAPHRTAPLIARLQTTKNEKKKKGKKKHKHKLGIESKC